MLQNTRISIIVAMDEKRGIGKKNALMWNIPGELPRFKRITTGHGIIMGRKTWESLPFKPLPNRTNIVITHDPNYKADGAIVCDSIEKAIEKSSFFCHSEFISESQKMPKQVRHDSNCEVFIIGGGQIYKEALPYADRLYLTLVKARLDSPPESPARRGDFGADVFFPDYSEFKKVITEEDHEDGGYKYKFLVLERE